MKPETLLRLYPRKWREKYGDEFVALVEVTGLQPGDVTDVTRAAALEWLKVLMPTVVKGLGLYTSLWLAMLAMQWILEPHPYEQVRLSAWSDHCRILSLFLSTAVVSRLADVLALRGGHALSTRMTAQALGAGVSIFAMVAAYLVAQAAPALAVVPPFAILVVLSGTLLGRRPEMVSLLYGPTFTPRPPSIRGLGLSA